MTAELLGETSRRKGYGLNRARQVEHCAAPRQRVDVRRLEVLVATDAEIAPALVIAQDDDSMRLSCGDIRARRQMCSFRCGRRARLQTRKADCRARPNSPTCVRRFTQGSYSGRLSGWAPTLSNERNQGWRWMTVTSATDPTVVPALIGSIIAKQG